MDISTWVGVIKLEKSIPTIASQQLGQQAANLNYLESIIQIFYCYRALGKKFKARNTGHLDFGLW